MHSATLQMTMPSSLIEAADWDAGPVRELLVWSLAGPVLVWGAPPEFHEAERLGLVTFREPRPRELRMPRSKWVTELPRFGELTVTGRALALRLAYSAELTRLLELYLMAPEWGGTSPRLFLRELDLRDGGSGALQDWHAFAARCDADQLPRRGLDGQPKASDLGD